MPGYDPATLNAKRLAAPGSDDSMIWRETDSDRINQIINHPEGLRLAIDPVGGSLDVTPVLDNAALIALFGNFGGFMFWRLVPGIYEAQVTVLPEGKGEWALRAARSALRWMFEKEGALEIMMAAAQGDSAAHAVIKNISPGSKYRGQIENGWLRNGQLVPSDIFSLTKMDWEKCHSLH
jgi:hypothetical protein